MWWQKGQIPVVTELFCLRKEKVTAYFKVLNEHMSERNEENCEKCWSGQRSICSASYMWKGTQYYTINLGLHRQTVPSLQSY
jgi:predicted nucleic acid-binding Zn ribbon protein